VSSIWDLNPGFSVREVAPPRSPDTWLTNRTQITNVAITPLTNAIKRAAHPTRPPEPK
jgi:hypothetical protein